MSDSNSTSEAAASSSSSTTVIAKTQLPRDRFLHACPIRYECRRLFVYLIEMEYSEATATIETIVHYPDKRDPNHFADERRLADFVDNVKKFAFPFAKTLNGRMAPLNASGAASLVQFYTFVFTDTNRIRQYGFCRSAQHGRHVLCMVTYLPWYNVFMTVLNKVSTIINEKEVSVCV